MCARQQEVFKKDENIGQMAVKFVTEQVRRCTESLRGKLVQTGPYSRAASRAYRVSRSATGKGGSSVQARTIGQSS